MFGIWHFLYIGLTLFTVIVVLLCFKNKSVDLKQKATRIYINIAFGLYILDIHISENAVDTTVPKWYKLVQRFNEDTAERICKEVNKQLIKAFK